MGSFLGQQPLKQNPCNFHLYILRMGIHGMRIRMIVIIQSQSGTLGALLMREYNTLTSNAVQCRILALTLQPRLPRYLIDSFFHLFHSFIKFSHLGIIIITCFLPFIYSPIQYFPNCKNAFLHYFSTLNQVEQSRIGHNIGHRYPSSFEKFTKNHVVFVWMCVCEFMYAQILALFPSQLNS